MSRVASLLTLALVAAAGGAFAQTPQPSQPPGGTAGQIQTSDSAVVISQKHYIRQGNVELHDAQQKTDLYADLVEFFEDENRAVATGNVVLSQGNNRISAERAEFNTKTMLGTFYNASGIATVQPPKQQARPGINVPQMAGSQETTVYFFGETVEKIGPKKYKVTKGGFSTCVQPTPRWDMTASTMIINVDHYTFLKNTVMTVKGVPMLYLPVMYYPTKKGDRATGFLLPTWGTSQLRGQSLHNAFFWAIDRSEDLTVEHDFYSKLGQGVGAEYRYNRGAFGDGGIKALVLNQHAATYEQDGTSYAIPADRYFDIVGGGNQLLPGNMHARWRVNYPSNISTSQSFNTNIYDLSRNQRSYGGNVVGAWGSYSLNATLDHTEYFYNATDSNTTGSWPRIAFTRNERPVGDSPFYFSVATEYATLLRNSQNETQGELNQSVNRVDFLLQIRYPFKKWGWLTANSTISWRDTFYSRILAPSVDGVPSNTLTNESFNRKLWEFQTQITGPVFNRIWDTPDSGYAEKFKHSIEPTFAIDRISNVENFDRILYFDGTDYAYGGTTITYGVTNHFYAKRKLQPGQPGQAREILSVDLRQRYYTNQFAAGRDPVYQSGILAGPAPSNFGPVVLTARATPTNDAATSGQLTMEFDSRTHQLRYTAVNGSYGLTPQVSSSVQWTKRSVVEGLPTFSFPDQSITTQTTVRTKDTRLGGTYSLSYDIVNSRLLQQSTTAFYNAQCCGIAFQYMTTGSFPPYPPDRRFFLSFTLAGLGNFSPFNGAMSAVPR